MLAQEPAHDSDLDIGHVDREISTYRSFDCAQSKRQPIQMADPFQRLLNPRLAWREYRRVVLSIFIVLAVSCSVALIGNKVSDGGSTTIGDGK